MTTDPAASAAVRWTGLILTALPALLLMFSAAMKLIQPPGFEDGLAHLGLPLATVKGIGLLELACTALFLFPRTAVLGALLLTAYLGGATAIHVRVGDPFFGPVLLGVAIWGALVLRESRLRVLLPLRRG